MMFARFQRSDSSSFSTNAQQAVTQAGQEAALRRHAYIGCEHLLLALLRNDSSGAVRLLQGCNADPVAILTSLNAEVGAPAVPPSVHGEPLMRTPVVPYTNRAKKALELSVSNARNRRATQVRSEDLLIGLLQEERSVAVQALAHAGVTQERAQAALRTLHETPAASPRTAEPSSHEPAAGFRITIDDTSERTIFEQIVQQTQEAVATGTLSPGDRLPPVRQLADTLQIATGTVARAYAELERLGVVITDGARGTSVAPRPARVPAPDRPAALVGLLRPVVVAAFHLGAEANELRAALATAMHDIFRER